MNGDDDKPEGCHSFGIVNLMTGERRPRRCERMGKGGYVCLLMPGHVGAHEWTPFTVEALDAHFKAHEQ